MDKTKVNVALIEDDEQDARITAEAFAEGRLLVSLKTYDLATSFLEALERGEITDLILLDLNLPGMDGRELLEFLKTSDQYKSIPVIVLTTSKSEEDIIKSYRLHTNAYITKPVDPVQFIMVARSIENFWFEVVKIPTQSQAETPAHDIRSPDKS